MHTHSLCRGALLCFWVSLLFAASFCHGNNAKTVIEVVGNGECADCAESNIKTSHAFSGLHVTIDCKSENSEFKTRGVGELDSEGKFTASLPEEILDGGGNLKEDCFAQLHSASATPCPAYNSLQPSKIIFKSKTNGKHTFAPAGKLKFSPATCTSAFLWPHFKYPPIPIYKKPLPPPIPIYKKPLPPPIPIYKKPLPPFVPIYKKPLPPPVPIYKKPLPPFVPIYKKPLPLPVFKHPPIYKKPLPPSIPIYKPKPPVFKPKPPVVPIFKKPLPPSFPVYEPKFKLLPPFSKKPCPPFPKLPPHPKIPPKFFHHPKLAPWPPFSPHS